MLIEPFKRAGTEPSRITLARLFRAHAQHLPPAVWIKPFREVFGSPPGERGKRKDHQA
jgi:hypothetical protein